MKIIFFGLGSIGQRHARLLLKHFDHELYAFRSSPSSAKNDLGISELHTWKDVRSLSPDVAFISNPTDLHVKTAIECAELGINLFVEKPVDRASDTLDKLLNIVERKRLSTYVAYCLRFHPVIREMREYLSNRKSLHARVVVSSHIPDWRKGYDYRMNYSADEKRGGGVVLELSHEPDYISYLLGRPVRISGMCGYFSDLELGCEDYADMVMECDRGVANLHINFFSKKPERSVHVDLPSTGYISGDLIKNTVTICEDCNERIKKFNFERDDMFVDQLRYFFGNLGKKTMMNDLEEASVLFRKLVEFKAGHE